MNSSTQGAGVIRTDHACPLKFIYEKDDERQPSPFEMSKFLQSY